MNQNGYGPLTCLRKLTGYLLRYYLGGLGGHWGLKRPSCCCAVMLPDGKAFHLPELILKRLESISQSDPRATAGRPPGDRLKSQNQQKLVQKRAPKKNKFWTNVGAHSGPRMAPKMGLKLVPKLIFFGFIFGSLVFEVLELFGCLLGAFMGLWSLSWEASGLQKH